MTDFGIAKVAGEDVTARLTAPRGGVLGTATYIAPERLRGEPATGRSDLYAVAPSSTRRSAARLRFGPTRPPGWSGPSAPASAAPWASAGPTCRPGWSEWWRRPSRRSRRPVRRRSRYGCAGPGGGVRSGRGSRPDRPRRRPDGEGALGPGHRGPAPGARRDARSDPGAPPAGPGPGHAGCPGAPTAARPRRRRRRGSDPGRPGPWARRSTRSSDPSGDDTTDPATEQPAGGSIPAELGEVLDELEETLR